MNVILSGIWTIRGTAIHFCKLGIFNHVYRQKCRSLCSFSGSKGVAKCLASCEVSSEEDSILSKNTIGIVMTPLVSEDAIGAIEMISSPVLATVASRDIITTLIDMVMRYLFYTTPRSSHHVIQNISALLRLNFLINHITCILYAIYCSFRLES